MAHRIFVSFLILIALSAALSVGLVGWDYYTSPQQERVFRDDHRDFRPSGLIGHSLGVVGASMITVGVATYSARKRVKRLWPLGRLSTWLDVHIFLCLLGPTLIVYHSTFKAGGIAAISLWTMLTVAASGAVGRFLYVLIPRNASGAQLEEPHINRMFDDLAATLSSNAAGAALLAEIDAGFARIKPPESLGETVKAYFTLNRLSNTVLRKARRELAARRLDRSSGFKILKALRKRIVLIRRSIILGQVEQLFYYWHVIHLPFAVIMFLTLFVHVGVAIWLGYTWVF